MVEKAQFEAFYQYLLDHSRKNGWVVIKLPTKKKLRGKIAARKKGYTKIQ